MPGGIVPRSDLFIGRASIVLKNNKPAGVILFGGNQDVLGKQRRKVVSSWENDDAFDNNGMNVNATNMFVEAKPKLYQKECSRGITQLRFGNDGNALYSAGDGV